jgi:transcriptional regulator with XRE-family HTH domain
VTVVAVQVESAGVPIALSSIKRVRLSRGLSVRGFASRLGVTAGAVSQMERSEAAGKIGVDTLRRALEALGEDLVLTTQRHSGARGRAHRAPFARREERVSYELHRAVVKKLVDDPENVLGMVSGNLSRLRENVRGPLAQRWLDEWERRASGPIGDLVQTMLGEDNEAIEMRQNSPFAGVLTQAERLEAISRASEL